MDREQGFSLLELLITLSILTVVLLAAMPLYPSLSGSRLDYETTLLVSDLRFLQEISTTRQKGLSEFPSVAGDVAPEMQFDAGRYSIVQGIKVLRQHKYPEGLKIVPNRSRISFDETGDSHPTTIEISQNGRKRNVYVDIAGRIRVGVKRDV